MFVNLIFAVASLVASYFISAVFAEQPAPPKPASLDDFDFPQIEDGTPQTVIFGDVVIEGWMVLWYGNFRTSAIEAEAGK